MQLQSMRNSLLLLQFPNPSPQNEYGGCGKISAKFLKYMAIAIFDKLSTICSQGFCHLLFSTGNISQAEKFEQQKFFSKSERNSQGNEKN